MSMLQPALNVSTISRNPAAYSRDTTQDIHKVYRNVDPKLHPFEKGREYARALNAVKIEKVSNDTKVAAVLPGPWSNDSLFSCLCCADVF
jgi:hypothetical protein